MDTNKALARPGYLVALLLVITPLYDGLMTVWPPRFGDERWRFGALGSFSNYLLIPIMGILVALAITVLADHRRFRRILGWLCAIMAIVVAAAAVFFLLDYFQARAMIRPQLKTAMEVASATAAVKLCLAVLALILLSRAGLSAPRGAARKPTPTPESTATATPLVTLPGTARSG